MAALDYVKQAGLIVEIAVDKLRVRPAELITAELRQYLRDHKSELLMELGAANDFASPVPLIYTKQRPPVLTAATATSAWRKVRDLYINHLMTCRLCCAPIGRYCSTGAGLRSHYDKTPMEPLTNVNSTTTSGA